jgi:hypothetical protein
MERASAGLGLIQRYLHNAICCMPNDSLLLIKIVDGSKVVKRESVFQEQLN